MTRIGLPGSVGTALLAASLICSSAAAQVSWQAMGTMTTGVTNDPVPGAEGDATDSFTEISPALRLGLRSGRAVHQLQYTFASTIYARSFSDASSYSNAVALTSLVQASSSLRLGVGAGLTQGQQNSRGGSDLLEGGLQPEGTVSFVELGGTEGIDWQASPRWSVSQTLEGRFYRELAEQTRPPQPDALTLEGSAGAAHSFEVFRVGARLIGTYNANLEYVDAITPPAQINDRCRELPYGGCRFSTEHLQSFELRGESLFELSEQLSIELDAGLLEVSVSNAWGELYIQPTTLLALRFDGARATAALSFQHTFQPSLQLGETYRIERVRLEGRLPIGPSFRERWFVIAAAGYDFAQRIIVERNELGDSAHVYIAQLGVQWRVNDSVTALLRYELGGQTELGDIGGFSRHALLGGVEVRYPGERQPQPRLQPRRTAPHQIDQRRWQQLFDPAPGQQQPPPSPGASSQQPG